ncbi:hypothetical protein [Kosakonia oryziphila]|uniref:hypothetical protein n=1 Tax=Kosakonia oryziphila TaxID=1005667 RepID=UPI001112327A|nr:hypothetical protein [Kosakonia oryziphila]
MLMEEGVNLAILSGISLLTAGFFCCFFLLVESFTLLVSFHLTISANSPGAGDGYVLRRLPIAGRMLRHVSLIHT